MWIGLDWDGVGVGWDGSIMYCGVGVWFWVFQLTINVASGFIVAFPETLVYETDFLGRFYVEGCCFGRGSSGEGDKGWEESEKDRELHFEGLVVVWLVV